MEKVETASLMDVGEFLLCQDVVSDRFVYFMKKYV